MGVISVRYARALLKCATEEKKQKEVYDDMVRLAASYVQAPQLRAAIDGPMLPREDKLRLLLTAAGGDCATTTRTFLTVVLNEGRESMLQLMANSYASLYRQHTGLIQGRLTTAAAVTPEVEKKMQTLVEQKAHTAVEFETVVDPNIIGGFILEYDTFRMDASVKTQLQEIVRLT